MSKFEIEWKEDGWIVLQEADVERHQAEYVCFAEAGNVTMVRMRHSRGEQQKAQAYIDGQVALPMGLEDFKKNYKKGKIEIK